MPVALLISSRPIRSGVLEMLRSSPHGERTAAALVVKRQREAIGISWADVAAAALALHVLIIRRIRKEHPSLTARAAKFGMPGTGYYCDPIACAGGAEPHGASDRDVSKTTHLRELILRLGLRPDGANYRGRCPVCGRTRFRLCPSAVGVLITCSCGDPGIARLSIWRCLGVPVIQPRASEVQP